MFLNRYGRSTEGGIGLINLPTEAAFIALGISLDDRGIARVNGLMMYAWRSRRI